MVDSSRQTRSQYKPPEINIVGGVLLEDNFEHVKGKTDTQLQKDSTPYGMTAVGDGEIIVKMPLLNVLVSTYGTTTDVIKVHGFSRNFAGGGENMLSILQKIFLPEMVGLDPEKNRFDIFIVDGASNVQGAVFPQVCNIHREDHILDLFFDDTAKILEIKVCDLCHTSSLFLYN